MIDIGDSVIYKEQYKDTNIFILILVNIIAIKGDTCQIDYKNKWIPRKKLSLLTKGIRTIDL